MYSDQPNQCCIIKNFLCNKLNFNDSKPKSTNILVKSLNILMFADNLVVMQDSEDNLQLDMYAVKKLQGDTGLIYPNIKQKLFPFGGTNLCVPKLY